jgi:hypothetical protein
VASSKRFSVVRDPVHGDVYLSHEELAVLDTPQMQRLRGIKQLGSAHLVYPGAVHSRFEHSIGTLHVTQRMVEAVNRSAEQHPRECATIAPEEGRVIRMAALVHDVTHIPFGHHVEDQAGLMLRHDSPQRFESMLSERTELGRTLARMGLVRDVLNVLAPRPNVRDSAPPYWHQIIADTICSDLLDYLQRDAAFTGLKIQVDPRVLSYFRVDRATSNLYIDLSKHNLLREDILSEIVRLLEARYYFSERVYYHHAKVAAGALVARAVELALVHELLAEEAFHEATDDSLLVLLEGAAARGPARVAERIRSLVARYRLRRLPKRVCVFPFAENHSVQGELVSKYFARERHVERAAVEQRIADLVRFTTGKQVEVMVTCPARAMQLKEAQTHVRFPGQDELRPLASWSDRVPRLADLERSYRALWKFYVFADVEDPLLLVKIGEIAAGEFAPARNVYRPVD